MQLQQIILVQFTKNLELLSKEQNCTDRLYLHVLLMSMQVHKYTILERDEKQHTKTIGCHRCHVNSLLTQDRCKTLKLITSIYNASYIVSSCK